ncbi:MAG TPA: geranylgeranyl reductase family protein [Burkholderiales bacterium]|nr:geranylgeranyl reductase family protein [Burkholderiales bacterium]
MRSADVIVVGLGPAGASAAAAAARLGANVIALDRRREAGRPVQCAELVPALLEVDASAVRQRIDAMLTFIEDDAPDVNCHFPGRMLDRAAFDAALVQAAKHAGADVRLGAAVVRIGAGGVVHLADGAALRAPVIVGADGPRSRAGRASGAVNRELVETRQISVPLLAPHGATDIFLSAGIPGGYAWLFPKGEVANLGAGVHPPARARLKDIVTRLHARLCQAGRVGREILATTGGAIPVGGMLKAAGRLGDTLVLLAGDAAGLTNPVSGAGIAAAVHSGRLAGEAAVRGDAEGYQEELEEVYGAALERGLRRRRELMRSTFTKPALRRGWIAYQEYWQ